MDFQFKDSYNIDDLIEIVSLLRAPGGCPWDREQTHGSIRANLIEEAYEVAEAIDFENTHLLLEELGDLLLQILLHTQMEAEKGSFNFSDVCDGICRKLIYRHPHVFAGLEVDGKDTVLVNWEALKNKEKGRATAKERLESVPVSLPALMRTQKIQKRADEFGYGYNDAFRAIEDLESEISELKDALANGENPGAETGDILFSAANVARLLKVEAEEAIGISANKFVGRVAHSEEAAASLGKSLAELNCEERDKLWKNAKKSEGQ